MLRLLIILLVLATNTEGAVTTGMDRLFTPANQKFLKGKRVALCTNHTAINNEFKSSIQLLEENQKKVGYHLVALFGPEHGIDGSTHAEKAVSNQKHSSGIPIYSLYGTHRRPTPEMLKNIDTIVYDIQDIGSRSYTYISTLFYIMEEAAKRNIHIIVCDRPNPINGLTIDGPMLDAHWRSFVGYIDVPYCHGMTVAELARLFNKEYKVGCRLTVIPMSGWKRSMSYKDTGLPWIPTSPHIPEPDSPLFYPTTGILGELQIASVGIGYTLPFKVVGAPWIERDRFAEHLNAQSFPGVYFKPYSFTPFYGRNAKELCHGVLIVISDPVKYRPVSTQYLILGILKSLYPRQVKQALVKMEHRKKMFNKVNGTDEVYRLLRESRYPAWPLRALHEERRTQFAEKRKAYLIKSYQ
jgi:uncharacterized protein YbbC (DUF1343 family)